MSKGVISGIQDLVVFVSFDEEGPKIGELVQVDNEAKTHLLVERLNVKGQVLCLNLRSDLTIQKGMAVECLRKGIEVPVGDKTIGRIFDALGQPLDNLPPMQQEDLATRDILKLPPKSTNFAVKAPCQTRF
jgi:F-type H+-transporting ATPase subunit beta